MSRALCAALSADALAPSDSSTIAADGDSSVPGHPSRGKQSPSSVSPASVYPPWGSSLVETPQRRTAASKGPLADPQAPRGHQNSRRVRPPPTHTPCVCVDFCRTFVPALGFRTCPGLECWPCGTFRSALDTDPHTLCPACRGQRCDRGNKCSKCCEWSASQRERFGRRQEKLKRDVSPKVSSKGENPKAVSSASRSSPGAPARSAFSERLSCIDVVVLNSSSSALSADTPASSDSSAITANCASPVPVHPSTGKQSLLVRPPLCLGGVPSKLVKRLLFGSSACSTQPSPAEESSHPSSSDSRPSPSPGPSLDDAAASPQTSALDSSVDRARFPSVDVCPSKRLVSVSDLPTCRSFASHRPSDLPSPFLTPVLRLPARCETMCHSPSRDPTTRLPRAPSPTRPVQSSPPCQHACAPAKPSAARQRSLTACQHSPARQCSPAHQCSVVTSALQHDTAHQYISALLRTRALQLASAVLRVGVLLRVSSFLRVSALLHASSLQLASGRPSTRDRPRACTSAIARAPAIAHVPVPAPAHAMAHAPEIAHASALSSALLCESALLRASPSRLVSAPLR
ncbi:uncharacterized protein [Palaemon carinicauda]|uniref:uncharacterized protein n=1 Tax=Palaemon carinicauda TaxID=392227 RepID=UPI0035B620F4